MVLFFISAVGRNQLNEMSLQVQGRSACHCCSFNLKYNENEVEFYLDTIHPYHYEVCHLFVTGVEYCDFVVWTEKDIFIQRVLPDTEFWEK